MACSFAVPSSFVTIPASAGGPTEDEALPWVIDVNVFATAVSHTNWDTIVAQAQLMGAVKRSSGAQNDEISFDVILADGTWDIELLFIKTTSYGICSIQLDDVEQGTIDAYAAVTAYNVLQSITGITLATTAKKRLKIKVTSKNASSSGYGADIQHIQLRRTA